MNSIVIEKLSDLNRIIESPILITGNKNLQQEETHFNMRSISFTSHLAKKITTKDIHFFIEQFLQKKQEQISQLNQPATFYLWCDEQTMELRFNIISGHQSTLPFGCLMDMVDSIDPTIELFMALACNRIIPWDEITIIDDKESEEDPAYILKVFATLLFP